MRKVHKTQIQRQYPDCRVDVISRHGVVITSSGGHMDVCNADAVFGGADGSVWNTVKGDGKG